MSVLRWPRISGPRQLIPVKNLSCRPMNKLKVAQALGVSLLLAGLRCSEETGPRSGAILVPSPRLSNVSGPPDSTFWIPADRGWPPAQIPLINFPQDTWVTLESPGQVYLIAAPKLPGASSYYIFPSRYVPATGGVDHHPDGNCYLGLNVKDNYGILPPFGDCGGAVKVDTLLTRKNNPVLITRGPLPTTHYYECSTTSDKCHSLNPGDGSTVRQRPIPVTLRLKPSRKTSRFLTLDSLVFTASMTRDSIFVGGVMYAIPKPVITFWQWIGADTTRNPVPPWTSPCHSSTSLTCRYTPYEAGRMIVKAVLGGWEQTATTSVQCLLPDPSTPPTTFPYPSDSILNDSLGDFAVRAGLLDACQIERRLGRRSRRNGESCWL